MNFTEKKSFLLLIVFFQGFFSSGQTALLSHTLTTSLTDSTLNAGKAGSLYPYRKKRVIIIAGTQAAIWSGTFVALNKAWYASFPKSRFHLHNDLSEWNQMDKAGHIWTSYHISRISRQMWQWTGLSPKASTIFGGISGIAYQSIVEIQDGYSKQWGFSWGDMGANLAGAAAFVGQDMAWKDQRLQVKFSYSAYRYPEGLTARRDQLFGSTFHERILKDYNSQTYWLTGNLSAFFPGAGFPRWLNISAGYGSEGMLGGTQNVWLDKSGNPVNRSDIRRIRRWFIAPDVDLTRISTRSKLLQTVFSIVNVLKFPAPAIEFNTNGKIKPHLLYY